MSTGTKCCEHYKDGLPYCVECEKESTKAHDKACALLAEARADADHWKSECNALQRMVHEARAEIERLRNQNLDRASATLWAITRHAFMDGAFKGYAHGTEEKLRIQYFNEWCQKNYPEAVNEAVKQMRLIEQMRDALRLALPEARSTHCEQTILAALAAERGE